MKWEKNKKMESRSWQSRGRKKKEKNFA